MKGGDTVQLQVDLLLHLGSDRYEVTIVRGGKAGFKISSEEKIVFLRGIQEMRREYMERNTTVGYNFVIVVDQKMQWGIFCLKNVEEQPPVQLWRGKFVSERAELKNLVGVHYIQGKLLIIFDKFNVFYLNLPQELTDDKQPMINKQFIPYGDDPQYEHQDFSVAKGFLPQQQEYNMILTHYSNIDESRGMLMIAVESKSSKMSSIYCVEFDRKRSYFMSGSNVVLNIKGNVVGIFGTERNDVFLVQSSCCLMVWGLEGKGKEGTLDVEQFVFVGTLSLVRGKGVVRFVGVTSENQVVMVSLDKGGKKIKSSLFSLPSTPSQPLLQVFHNNQTSYLLTKKSQLLFSTQTQTKKIVTNQHTKIIKSKLSTSNYHNFLIVEKGRGEVLEKVVLGQHLFAYDCRHFAHGMMFNSADIVGCRNGSEGTNVFVGSPLIGLIKINLDICSKNKKEGKSGQILSLTTDKAMRQIQEQTLFLSQTHQITQEHIYSPQSKPIPISQLFQNATDFITSATVLSNQWIVLSISQQLHVFDQKYKRKYIYCFNSQIKKIYNLNDVNVIGVELYSFEGEGNELSVLVLEQDKATRIRDIAVPDGFRYVQLQTVVNTSDYRLNLFGGVVVVCSSDSLHKYQVDKISVVDFELPMPVGSWGSCVVVPLVALGRDRNNTDFMVMVREERVDLDKKFDQVELYIGSFSAKYLLTKLDLSQLHISYEKMLTLTQLPHDFVLFAFGNYCQDKKRSGNSVYQLGVVGEKYISVFSMKYGRVELEWLSSGQYIQRELEKIEEISRDIKTSCINLEIEQPVHILPTNKTDYFLLHNSQEIYYACYHQSKMTTISYYSLINDQFTTFRNNLALPELNDQDFMETFSQKMRIRDIKYLRDGVIFVLYEYCIVVLEVGVNNSLVVREELKFKSSENTQVVKIQQFLQNYDEDSIYLRQSHGRIFLLKKCQDNYKIIFHSYMDEDVLLFSRVNNWHDSSRKHILGSTHEESQRQYQQLVLKKDGQLIVTSKSGKQEPNKYVYL